MRQNVIPPGLTRLAVELRGPSAWSLATHSIHNVVRYTAKNVFTGTKQYRLSDGAEIGGRGRARPVTAADEEREARAKLRRQATNLLHILGEVLTKVGRNARDSQNTAYLQRCIEAARKVEPALVELLSDKDGAG